MNRSGSPNRSMVNSAPQSKSRAWLQTLRLLVPLRGYASARRRGERDPCGLAQDAQIHLTCPPKRSMPRAPCKRFSGSQFSREDQR